MRRPGLALDVDTPDDLAAFLAAPSPTRAYAYLTESGIGRRISRLQTRSVGAAVAGAQARQHLLGVEVEKAPLVGARARGTPGG